MAILKNKWRLSANSGETQEEQPRNGQSRNTSVPRISEGTMEEVGGPFFKCLFVIPIKMILWMLKISLVELSSILESLLAGDAIV